MLSLSGGLFGVMLKEEPVLSWWKWSEKQKQASPRVIIVGLCERMRFE